MTEAATVAPDAPAGPSGPSPAIFHLSHKPPFTAGSYNRFLGSILRSPPTLSQAMVSYWDGPLPSDNPWGDRLLLVNGRRLSLGQRLWLRLPERFRGARSNGISGRLSLKYAWGVIDLVKRLRPRVIVCYDGTKFGRLLRSVIDWPCRLVLAQRGYSYCLNPRDADLLYNLDAFDVVWSMTKTSYQFDRERGLRFEPSVYVIPNGIDTRLFKPVESPAEKARLRTTLGLPLDRPIVLFLARVVPKKGPHLLVEAWDRVLARVPNALLWLVGGGDAPYLERLRSIGASLGTLDSMRFQGPVTPEQTVDCYRAADVFALPSVGGEGQARSLLEAMASGLACVTSDHAATREAYRDDELVIVPDPNLQGQFAQPIVELLENAERRETLGRNARRGVVERFDDRDRNADLQALLAEQLRLVSPPA